MLGDPNLSMGCGLHLERLHSLGLSIVLGRVRLLDMYPEAWPTPLNKVISRRSSKRRYFVKIKGSNYGFGRI